ncbi:MarR family winged helix-turn-helix transcriptional regulator [Sphingobium sp.]|uniref:MarR family winged helix-turn-helix transcriptional regulator n=1 Tax=Sphingobium sp. TaxID=1912891 RepID=UPI002C45D6D4|nr:MarR family transcriptional regulator [Sphingobium sp.]HUD93609.1 MarR family transcriptional regulator [Sphingobium sp.]
MPHSDETRLRVDRQLALSLYGAVGRVVRMHKPLLEPLGLTFPQYLVVVELLGGSPRSVGELGLTLGMDTGTITPLLKRMEQGGTITRRRDTKDERRVLVALTPSGAALREGVLAIPAKINSGCRMTDEQANALRETLDELAGATGGKAG